MILTDSTRPDCNKFCLISLAEIGHFEMSAIMSHRAFFPRCELFDSVIMRSILFSAIFLAILAKQPGVSPNSISILTKSVGFP